VLAQGIVEALAIHTSRFEGIAAGAVGEGQGRHPPHVVGTYLESTLPARQGRRGPADGQVSAQPLCPDGHAQRRHCLYQPLR
jgi:hypothetical protein